MPASAVSLVRIVRLVITVTSGICFSLGHCVRHDDRCTRLAQLRDSPRVEMILVNVGDEDEVGPLGLDRSAIPLTGSTMTTLLPCSICTLPCPSAVITIGPPPA